MSSEDKKKKAQVYLVSYAEHTISTGSFLRKSLKLTYNIILFLKITIIKTAELVS